MFNLAWSFLITIIVWIDAVSTVLVVITFWGFTIHTKERKVVSGPWCSLLVGRVSGDVRLIQTSYSQLHLQLGPLP